MIIAIPKRIANLGIAGGYGMIGSAGCPLTSMTDAFAQMSEGTPIATIAKAKITRPRRSVIYADYNVPAALA